VASIWSSAAHMPTHLVDNENSYAALGDLLGDINDFESETQGH
jgi:hypothetical protein